MLIKLLSAALAVLLVLFIALCWLVAVLAKVSLWLPGGLTAFVVLAAISVLVYRRLRANAAARGLEKALAVQAKQQAAIVRPDLQIEVQRMQDEFDKAVHALKTSKLGNRGRDALYLLPWYTIIGPPGAGKSTALRSSGLNFPYTSHGGAAAVKGLGGTRNCDWWLTNEAVVLDTAGRWSTQEEDHDEWMSFLGLLKKYRPKKPLNGLITAISVGDVVNAHEDEVEALALRMRERLDEVQTQLRVSIPVYVLFTKCDLIEGFLETFGDLKRSERNQVWGFTAPLAQPIGEPGAYFASRFDELDDVLERRSLARMGDDRNLERRAKVYAFPQQYAVLRRNLSKFIGVMFQDNIYQQTPCLRGVYFTSGTQEGRPFNLLMNRLADSMGIKRKVEPIDAAIDQKSYFLHDVFMNVIFEDRGIASASDAELKRLRLRRHLVTSVLALCSLAFGGVPGYAWSLNKLQLHGLQTAVDEWEAPARKQQTDKEKLERLEPLRNQVNTLIAYEQSGAPLSMRMGMYQSDELVTPMRRYYANLLRRELVQPLLTSDLEAMADFGFRYAALPRARPTADEHVVTYEQLKLHLFLTQPKGSGEPPFGEAEQAWVKDRLLVRWSQAAGKDPTLLDAAKTNAALYPSFIVEFPDLAFTRDKEVVQRVRATLNRVPPTARVLEHLVATVEQQEDYGLTIDRLVGATSALQSEGKVRGAFTRRGYESAIRDRLTPEAIDDAGELWVLGLADSAQDEAAQREQLLAQLRSAYFKQYIEEWRAFLNGVRVASATEHTAALEVLRELSRGMPPPIAMLMHKLAWNVQLKPKATEGLMQQVEAGAVDKLKTKLQTMLGKDKAQKLEGQVAALTGGKGESNVVSEADVARSFEGFYSFAVPPDSGEQGGPRPAVAFDAYQEQLAFVRDALQTYLDDPEQSQQLQKKLQEARVRVRSLIEQQQVGMRPQFEALLWPPIENAASSSTLAIAGSAASSWCNDIVAEYERAIVGRYPFHRDGQDMPIADFDKFYRPKEGRVWAFAGAVLGDTIVLDGNRYVFSTKLGQDASTVYTPSLLEFIDRSHDIAASFYPTDEKAPRVEFEVKVQPSPAVASTQFSVGGKAVEHYNGPEKWKTLVWPGDSPEAGASLIIRGANGMHERISQDGPWGLFRLLEAGTLMPGAGRTFTIAWQLQTHDVTLRVDFRPKRGESPFFGVPGKSNAPIFLQPVRAKAAAAPRQILRTGKPCKGGE